MKQKVTRDAYVLTRIYNDYSCENKFLKRLENAALSVCNNAASYNCGNVIWIIYDDSPEADENYQKHHTKLLEICLYHGFSEEYGNLIYVRDSERHGNSAYATFRVREEFLKCTEGNDKAFAVLLDQDDVLEPKAIMNIAEKMQDNRVVLLPFTIINDGGKDITKDGGKVHNRLTKKIRKKAINNKTAPNVKQSHINSLEKIYYASSLSWSKSYSRFALKLYHESLKQFLNNERESVLEYYNSHPAYEDFVDFYVMLRSDITISATRHKTHKYYKHVDAITCQPNIDAFRFHRTASLLTLIDLCYSKSTELRADFKQLLLRFITIKIVDIERILAGYRKDYLKGINHFYVFSDETHEGYFINKLYRLAQGDRRGTQQDENLFKNAHPVRCKETKKNFDDLFSCENLNSIKVYQSDLEGADCRHTIQKAYFEENKFRHEQARLENCYLYVNSRTTYCIKKLKKCCKELKNSLIWKDKEEKGNIYYDSKRTPNQRRLRVMGWFVFINLIILIASIIIAFNMIAMLIQNDHSQTASVLLNKLISQDNFQIAALFVTAGASIWVAIITFLLNEYSKTNILAKEEGAKKKLYFNEFEDLIRHLEANLKVMIEIRHQSKDGKIPASIHFINLSWPNSSCLFSDDITSLLDKDKVDDFARLKVNLRNIQNSSTWLSTYVKENHTYEEICDAIDWEITRHIGYLVNFRYLKEHNFQSPEQHDIELYIGEKHVKENLTGLFISYHGEGKRMEEVEKYINLYFCDRRECRSVLLYDKHS